jgi:hypothetical protein
MPVTLVPKEHVMGVWDKVKPHMEKAAEYTYGRYDVDDILDSIMQYDHALWIAYEGDKVVAAVVTYFKHYPKKKYLDLEFIGSDTGATTEWKAPVLKMLQHYAYDTKCDGIESSGRVGWSKMFKNDGYKALFQTYELPIADCGLGE